MKDVTAMRAEGGFQLTTFVSSSKDFLVFIPEGERGKGLQYQELKLPAKKALCIHWNIGKDKLGFDVNFKDNHQHKTWNAFNCELNI